MFAVERADGDDRLLVVVNAGRERETQAITREQFALDEATLVWGAGALSAGENQTSISMAPRAAAIWTLTPRVAESPSS
jgi:hypothetical protein